MVSSGFRNAYTGFFIAALLGVAVSAGPMLWRLWRISVDPVSTRGRVVRLDCRNHGHLDYSFDIDGVPHSGSNHSIDGISCPEVRIGQPVAVYYEKGAPENNYGLYPAETAGNRASTAFFTCVAFMCVFIFIGPLFLGGVWIVVSRLAGKFDSKPRVPPGKQLYLDATARTGKSDRRGLPKDLRQLLMPLPRWRPVLRLMDRQVISSRRLSASSATRLRARR